MERQAETRSGKALNILAGSLVLIIKAKGIRVTFYKEHSRWGGRKKRQKIKEQKIVS